MNTDSSLVAELREKAYRDAYVEAQIRMTLPLQVRELRKRQEWTQPELAEKAGMAQPRISELEKPGERRLTIETLLRLAAAFDVGLQVRFLPFAELVDWSEGLDVDTFNVLPFEKELAEIELAAALAVVPKKPSARAAAAGANAGAAAVNDGARRGLANMPAGGNSGNKGDYTGEGSGIFRNA